MLGALKLLTTLSSVFVADMGNKSLTVEIPITCKTEKGNKIAVLYPPPQFPSGTERFRAVLSRTECFLVFPIIFQLGSERFRAVPSNSERFRVIPNYFIQNLKVHF